MRSFDDDHGNSWQAALMEASYGNVLLVFSRIGAADVLQTPMFAEHLREAEQQLADTDEAGLRKWLAEASPWEH